MEKTQTQIKWQGALYFPTFLCQCPPRRSAVHNLGQLRFAIQFRVVVREVVVCSRSRIIGGVRRACFEWKSSFCEARQHARSYEDGKNERNSTSIEIRVVTRN